MDGPLRELVVLVELLLVVLQIAVRNLVSLRDTQLGVLLVLGLDREQHPPGPQTAQAGVLTDAVSLVVQQTQLAPVEVLPEGLLELPGHDVAQVVDHRRDELVGAAAVVVVDLHREQVVHRGEVGRQEDREPPEGVRVVHDLLRLHD